LAGVELLPPHILNSKNKKTKPRTMPSCGRALPFPLATERAKRVEVLPSDALNESKVLLCGGGAKRGGG
jgi:hypothetical protein